jgi:hypothetical protein
LIRRYTKYENKKNKSTHVIKPQNCMKTPSDGVQYIAKNAQSARLHEQKRYLKSIHIDNNTKKNQFYY